jgi:hypothetical protein
MAEARMTARQRVEQAAITTAESYAKANGAPIIAGAGLVLAGAGLVLAGMVIGASLSVAARKELIAGYLAQHPTEAGALMGRWANLIDRAAES